VVLREGLHKSNDAMSYIHHTDGPAEYRGLLVERCGPGGAEKAAADERDPSVRLFARRL